MKPILWGVLALACVPMTSCGGSSPGGGSDASTDASVDASNDASVDASSDAGDSGTKLLWPIEVLSKSASGEAGEAGSSFGELSGNGRYGVFSTSSTNLTNDDLGATTGNLFRRDRTGNTVLLLSVDDTGAAAGVGILNRGIQASTDGSKIAFIGKGSAPGPKIYVRDTLAGTTTQVCVTSTGTIANKECQYARISGNGRYAAFLSRASNLAGAIGRQAYVHDMDTGVSSLVSKKDGQDVDDDVGGVSVSGDGSVVAFFADAPNFSEALDEYQVYVTTNTGTNTILASTNAAGVPANRASFDPVLSRDGNHVVFFSDATNLVTGETVQLQSVYLKNLVTGAIEVASVDPDGNSFVADRFNPRLDVSADGRFVVFIAERPGPGGSFQRKNIYRYDRNLGKSVRVSLGSDLREPNGDCQNPSISDDGSLVGFTCSGQTLVEGVPRGQSYVVTLP